MEIPQAMLSVNDLSHLYISPLLGPLLWYICPASGWCIITNMIQIWQKFMTS